MARKQLLPSPWYLWPLHRALARCALDSGPAEASLGPVFPAQFIVSGSLSVAAERSHTGCLVSVSGGGDQGRTQPRLDPLSSAYPLPTRSLGSFNKHFLGICHVPETGPPKT